MKFRGEGFWPVYPADKVPRPPLAVGGAGIQRFFRLGLAGRYSAWARGFSFFQGGLLRGCRHRDTGELKNFKAILHIFRVCRFDCESFVRRRTPPCVVPEGGSGVETAECWLHQGAASDSLPPHQIWQPSNCNYIEPRNFRGQLRPSRTRKRGQVPGRLCGSRRQWAPCGRMLSGVDLCMGRWPDLRME